MIRKFNYTGRLKIARSRVKISLLGETTQTRSFNAELDLNGLDLPNTAKVYVEPFCHSSASRFDFGTIGNLAAPVDRELKDIDFGARILFRVKVVDETGELPLILAAADGITPVRDDEHTDNHVPLLPVESRDLGEEVFRVEYDSAGCVLLVNNRIPNYLEMMKSDLCIQSLIYPTVFREILTKIIHIEQHRELNGDIDDWRDLWLRFAKTTVGYLPDLGEDDDEGSIQDRDDWINDVIRTFSKKRRLATALAEQLQTLEDDCVKWN